MRCHAPFSRRLSKTRVITECDPEADLRAAVNYATALPKQRSGFEKGEHTVNAVCVDGNREGNSARKKVPTRPWAEATNVAAILGNAELDFIAGPVSRGRRSGL